MTARDNRGYSLLELAIVLSLVSILLGFGASNLRAAMAREELDGWVRSIAYEVGAGQQAAITRRSTVTIGFQDQTFSVSAGGTTLRQETLPSHITLGSTLQVVTFDRRGTPSGGLTLTVTSTTAGQSYAITIEANTGRATFSEL